MKHTKCQDCKLREGDCGYHYKIDGVIHYVIPNLCDKYGNCKFFQKAKAKRNSKRTKGEIFPMEIVAGKCLIDANGDCPLRPQGEWIPVSERLPSDNEPYEVLCCDIRGEIMIGHPFEDECSECGYSAESECYEMYECVAWQPLPEPYKKGGTKND